MSAATNRQIADAFREARRALRCGEHSYICNAIPSHFDGADAARAVIAERLGGGRNTLFSWLVKQGHMTDKEMGLVTYQERTEFRISWLDALIEEFDPATGSASHG